MMRFLVVWCQSIYIYVQYNDFLDSIHCMVAAGTGRWFLSLFGRLFLLDFFELRIHFLKKS
jgi:hypothetical protein